MKLITFHKNGLRLGVKTASSGIIDVAEAKKSFTGEFSRIPENVNDFLRGGNDALQALKKLVDKALSASNPSAAYLVSEDGLEYGPCLPAPGKIICVGTNYRKHAEESKMPIPAVPIIFNKFANTIAAHGEPVPIPFNTDQADYEAELGIVIGKTAKRVSKENALDYVFGYCNVNDLSARDLQFRTHQWLLGKSCDKFSPVGPYLVSADEVGDPNNLRISCIVNGEVRQNSNTADMIFKCDELVSYISQHMTLDPGDIILTGTPEGVVFNGFDGKTCFKKDHLEWLKPGDLVTVEIEKLGSLTNRMVEEV